MKRIILAAVVLSICSTAFAQQFNGQMQNKPMHFGPPIAPMPTPPQMPQTVFAPNGQTATIHDNGAMGKTIIAPNGQIYNVQ